MSNENKWKNTGTEIVKPKIFNLSSETLFMYQTNILLRSLKFSSTPIIIWNSNLTYKNYTRRMRLAEFFQNKKENISEKTVFQKQSTFILLRNRDRDLDHQIDVLKNLSLEKMETKSKSNLSNMKQKELLKLSNVEAIVTYSLSYNLAPRISPVLIGQPLIFCSLMSPTCCNSPRKCTPVKYKKRQKAGFQIATYTTS